MPKNFIEFIQLIMAGGVAFIGFMTLVGCIAIVLFCVGLSALSPQDEDICKLVSSRLPYEECAELSEREAMDAAFPEGETTKEEVRQVLGKYFVEEDEISGNRTSEEYDLTHTHWYTMIYNFYEPWVFYYDAEGVLYQINWLND